MSGLDYGGWGYETWDDLDAMLASEGFYRKGGYVDGETWVLPVDHRDWDKELWYWQMLATDLYGSNWSNVLSIYHGFEPGKNAYDAIIIEYRD